MTPPDDARWRRASALVDELLDLPVAERESRLAARAAGDATLAADVRAWLAALERDTGLPAECPLPPEGLARVGQLAPGTRLGPWRVVEVAGTGGMGTVYAAERADGAFEKRVALKVTSTALVAERVGRRFLAERSILAGLEHPNIAQLLDAGVTDDGQPWYAMEFVAGEPLDQWCARQAPDLATRLRLFRQVLAAVMHAHRRLVVHRDLKPSNVLVTPDGTAKLLDFGIARLLSPDGAGDDGTATVDAMRTPAYASPEQIQGGEPTVATDIYSLGVMLYELVTGRRPFSGSGSVHALEAAILSAEPPAPSAVAPPPLRRALRGDLDAIILTAIAKAPARRYPSVEALDGDLAAFLGGLPVRARPDSWGYRSGLFLRRHWAAVTVGALAATALVVLTVVAQVQAGRARREAQRAEEVAGFLVGLLELPYPYDSGGGSGSLRALLDAGLAKVDSLERAGRPVDVEVLEALTLGYSGLSAHTQAGQVARRALAQQLRARAPDTSLIDSRMLLGVELMLAGEEREARTEVTAALATAARVLGPAHVRVAQLQVTLAGIERRLGNLDAAERAASAGIAILERDPVGARIALAHAHNHRGHIALERGDLARAEAEHRRALAIRERVGASPLEVATSLSNLAVVVAEAGRVAEGESLLARAWGIKAPLLDSLSPELSDEIRNASRVALLGGDAPRALALARSALARYEARAPSAHWRLVPVHVELAEALLATGARPEAARWFQVALDTLARAVDGPAALRARALAGLAATARADGHRGAAEAWARRCREEYEALGRPAGPCAAGS
ncbi:MAG: serine/threonine protein kinase [Gemmatimonadetes bacterium]|nr:serine/threonine protein kinase [Gemmatimonadota bacterium]